MRRLQKHERAAWDLAQEQAEQYQLRAELSSGSKHTHVVLRNGSGHRILPIASSPTNADNMVRSFERLLRRACRELAG